MRTGRNAKGRAPREREKKRTGERRCTEQRERRKTNGGVDGVDDQRDPAPRPAKRRCPLAPLDGHADVEDEDSNRIRSVLDDGRTNEGSRMAGFGTT